jgi:GT2 family glycosyltransferase
VDLCLRLQQAGYRIVYTPYALLYHHESATRGNALNPRDIATMKVRWGSALASDPFYNPNFSLKGGEYKLDL